MHVGMATRLEGMSVCDGTDIQTVIGHRSDLDAFCPTAKRLSVASLTREHGG
jgi:hypothetical protein